MINTQNGLKKISKIVTFYEDGTFTEFTPSPYMPTTIPPAYTWPNYQVQPNWPQNPWYTSPTCGNSGNIPCASDTGLPG